MATPMQAKVRKLADILEELNHGGCEITRLTTIKSLCQEPEVAGRFVTYLARKTLEQRGRAKQLPRAKRALHHQLMSEAVAAMEAGDGCSHLSELLYQIKSQQDEYKPIKWGRVRIIHDSDLLTVEFALTGVLSRENSAYWAYQTARQYAERYDARYPTGLTPASRPMVQDIVDFWQAEVGAEKVDQEGKKGKKSPRSRRGGSKPMPTHRQGQFLAFIQLYCKLHRRAPSEAEMVQFFQVTPPSVHSMIVKLHELGLIEREPHKARSLRVTVRADELPPLEDVAGAPW